MSSFKKLENEVKFNGFNNTGKLKQLDNELWEDTQLFWMIKEN